MHTAPFLLVLIVAAHAAAPAAGQRVLVSRAGPGVAPATELIDVTTGVVTRLTDDATDRAQFVLDGSVLLRRVSGEFVWRVRFLSSGFKVPLPDGSRCFSDLPGRLQPHPRQPAIFDAHYVFSPTFVKRLDARGQIAWQPCSAQQIDSFDLSPDGPRLFVLCKGTPGTAAFVAVVASGSGAVLRNVPVDAANNRAASIVVGPGAAEFLTLRTSDTPPYEELVRADLVTGQRLVSVPVQMAAGVGPWVGLESLQARSPVVRQMWRGSAQRAL